MPTPLRRMRPVYVVGVGLDRYARASERSYVDIGLSAIRAALDDAGIEWPAVDSFYLGTAQLGMAPGRAMIRHLGATGIPIAQVENASASGSTSFRQACIDVASGIAEVSMAAGVDKPGRGMAASRGGTPFRDLIGFPTPPAVQFAMLATRYMRMHGITLEQLASVAVKNHRNGALNPFAQRQKERTLAEVLEPPRIAGPLTRLQCCPVGEGGAAAIVASEEAMTRLGLSTTRAVRVLSSVSRSERVYDAGANSDAELTAETVRMALEEAEIAASDLDVIELHDAFSIEELLYAEAIGLCAAGEAAQAIERGDFDIGGRCALSPSGGLLSMGHPIGPTGVGQIAEVTRQLRGEAGPRQQPGANTGMAHMVGVGAVCVVHILHKP